MERDRIIAKFTKLSKNAKNIVDFDDEEKFLEQSTIIDESFKDFKGLTYKILELSDERDNPPWDLSMLDSVEEILALVGRLWIDPVLHKNYS